MPFISAVVPVYNEESCLPELSRRLMASLPLISPDFEIIFVDDGSRDGSWAEILGLTRTDARMKGLRLTRNFGQQRAIAAGMDHSSGGWVAIMDCDLQDRPEEIPRLYSKVREGFEIALADRGRRNDPPSIRLASRLFYFVFNLLSGIGHYGRAGNFGIMSRKAADTICSMRERTRFLGGLIDWTGFPVAYVEVVHDRRCSGKSAYSFPARCVRAAGALIAYAAPMRPAVKLGLCSAAAAFCCGAGAIYFSMIRHASAPDWSVIAAPMYFLAGAGLLLLCVIGMYAAYAFEEIRARPLYVVLDKAGLK